MDEHAPARSTMQDLQDVGSLFLRRQCSIGVLRINFERAAIRLRLLAPDTVDDLRGYLGRLDEIAARPANEQYLAVASLLDGFDRWIRSPVTPPRALEAPLPEVSVLDAPVPEAPAVAPPAFFALDDPMDAPRRVS